MTDRRVSVGVVSPRAVVRAGLTVMLSGDGHISVTDHDHAAVVVYDVGGLARRSTRDLLRHHVEAGTPVVGLLTRGEHHLGRGALVLGAATVLPESVSRPDLVEVLRSVVARGRVAPSWPTLVGTPLTVRELTVLRLVAGGLSNEQVAAHLHLSPNSIKTYIRVAYRKIGVDRRSLAVRWVIAHGQAEQVAVLSQASE